jgi:hemoglobin/transferrin/lactoferrin receptor protein
MRLITSIFLVLFGLGLFAQIKVVNQKLQSIEGVQLLNNNNVLTISNSNGEILFDTSLLDTTYLMLYHGSFHPKKLTKAAFKESNIIILSHKTASIDPIVVTPNRHHRKLSDIALKLDVIGRDAINLFQPQTSADLLNLENKVYIQKSQQGGGSPMIRGFATNRILLVMDGVRMNTAIFRSGNVQNVIAIDPFAVETTEVIFGPGSQFYGSDAIGGVLSFKTKAPTFSTSDTSLFKGNIAIRTSSANHEKTWHFDFNAGGEKVASITSFSFSSFGDLTMGKNGPELYTRPHYSTRFEHYDSVVINEDKNKQVFSKYNQFNLMQKLSFKINDSANLTYNFQLSTSSNIPRYDRLILPNDSGLVNANWYYGPQKWMLNQIFFENSNTHLLADHILVSIAHQKFEESRNDRKFNSIFLRQREESLDAISVNTDFSKSISSTLEASYGLEWIHNKVRSKAKQLDIIDLTSIPVSTRYPDGSTWQSGGAYFNLLKKWNSWYKTEAGLRYNWVSATGVFDTTFFPFPVSSFTNTNDALTGSVSQLFKLKKGSIGVVTSSAFRSPNIDDISKVFDSNPGQVILPNPNLKPEFAYNAEVNFNYLFKKRIKTSIAVFYTHLNNAISTSNSTFNGSDSIIYDGVLSKVQTLDNQNFATVYGAQLTLEYKIDSAWSITSNYTILSSTASNNQPIRHITPNFGGTSINFRSQDLSLSVYALYNQKFNFEQFTINEKNDAYLYIKDENGNPYSPAWITLNMKANYPFKENLSLTAGIENILNKRYRPYGSGITAPGRNFMLTLLASF